MWLIKYEEDTDPRYGKYPYQRSIEELIKNSIVVVDKHVGPTSYQISNQIKKIFKVKKASHAGTLDPKVSGVLPIALEKATKILEILIGSDKEYVGIMYLHKDIELEFLRKIIAEKFVGKIKQVPPRRSAVAKRERERKVYYFDILEKDGKNVLFKVKVEAGTYIRKLVHDIGKYIKIGAHLKELRRIRAGKFSEEKAKNILEIENIYKKWERDNKEDIRKILVPVEDAIDLKKVFVKDSAIDAICHGAPLYTKGIVRIEEDIVEGERVGIFSLKDELIAIGIAKMNSKKMYESEKGIAIKTDKVLMEKGTYPSWKDF